jgi:hypothetical protein
MLSDSIKLLLNIPSEISKADDNAIFKQIQIPIIRKALVSGLQNLSLAVSAVDCVLNLHQKLKRKVFLNYSAFIVPLLSGQFSLIKSINFEIK